MHKGSFFELTYHFPIGLPIEPPSTMSFIAVEASQKVLDLLDRLHTLSSEQESKLKDHKGQYTPIDAPPAEQNRLRDESMKDMFIALDADKSHFMYNLVRATGALNVVECGTSYGVSTIYLALAVGQNAQRAGKKPGEAKVIGTEHWVSTSCAFKSTFCFVTNSELDICRARRPKWPEDTGRKQARRWNLGSS